jgi:hypothetical protein
VQLEMSVSDKHLEMSVSVAWEWREWGEVAGSGWFFDVNSRGAKIQVCLYSHSKDLVLVSIFNSKLIKTYLEEECGNALENDEELTPRGSERASDGRRQNSASVSECLGGRGAAVAVAGECEKGD